MTPVSTSPSGFGLGDPRFSNHLLESLPGPSLLCDQSNAVRGWNQRALAALGLGVNELFGRPLPEVLRNTQGGEFARELQRARTQGMGEVTLPFQVPEGPSPRFTFRLMGLREDQQDWVIVTAVLAQGGDGDDRSALALLNRHPFGVLVMHTYRITYANPVSAELLDFPSAGALQGVPLSALVYHEDRGQMGYLLKRALTEVHPQDHIRFRSADGSPSDMEVSLTLLEGQQQPTIQAVFRPISRHQGLEQAFRRYEERQWKLLNHALQKSESRLRETLNEALENGHPPAPDDPEGPERSRFLLESLPTGYWEADRDGRAVNINSAMAHMLGLSSEDLIGRPLGDFLPDDESDSLMARFREARPQGPLETRLRRGDSGEVPVSCRMAPLPGEPADSPGGWVLWFTDISALRALRLFLNRRQQADQTIFEHFPGVFLTARSDLSLVYWNHALPEETGLAGEELAGMTADKLVPPGQQRHFRNMLRSGEGAAGGNYLETPLATPDGESSVFRLYPIPLPGGEEEAYSIVGIRSSGASEAPPAEAQIANNGGFHFILRREVARSYRYKHPLSLMTFSVAHFPGLQAHYGQEVGRKVLKSLEDLLRRESRETDLVGHNEEGHIFLLAPETGNDDARKLGERLKQLIHLHDFDPVAWVRPMTGIATYRRGESPEELIRRSREALCPSWLPQNGGALHSKAE